MTAVTTFPVRVRFKPHQTAKPTAVANTIKNTSLALTIGLMELTGRARAMQEFSFHVFEAFAAATLIYLLVNLCVVLAMRKLENRLRLPGYIGSASNAPQAGH